MVVEHPTLASDPEDRVRGGLGARPDLRAGLRPPGHAAKPDSLTGLGRDRRGQPGGRRWRRPSRRPSDGAGGRGLDWCWPRSSPRSRSRRSRPALAAAARSPPARRRSADAAAVDASKLRGDLAGLVAGTTPVDPRLAERSCPATGRRARLLRVLSEPDDAAHAGRPDRRRRPRILRSYRTIDLSRSPRRRPTVRRSRRCRGSRCLDPVEVVVALGATPSASSGVVGPAAPALPDQTRGTAGDLGRRELWSAGITGRGVTDRDPRHRHRRQPTGPRRPGLRALVGLLPAPPKVVEPRNFNGGGCTPGRDRRRPRPRHARRRDRRRHRRGRPDLRTTTAKYAGHRPGGRAGDRQGPHRCRRRHQQRPARGHGVGGHAGRAGPRAAPSAPRSST